MKPYSIEFRRKVIEVHEKESLSIRKTAQHFQVAKSFIQKLVKQYRETIDLLHESSDLPLAGSKADRVPAPLRDR